jgi:prepilin-type processing-associated H-X9-DG protein
MCEFNKMQPYVKNTQMWYCPSAPTVRYGINMALTSVALGNIRYPSQTVIVSDTAYGGPFTQAQYPPSTGLACAYNAGIRTWACLPVRHNSGDNLAFVDGHVKWMAYQSVVGALNSTVYWVP